MIECLFIDDDNRPIPVLPIGGRVADGVTVFNLSQAAEKFGETQDRLRKYWNKVHGETVLGWDEPALTDAGTPAVAVAGEKPKAEKKADPGVDPYYKRLPLTEAIRLRALHRSKYPELDNDVFERLVEFCRRHGLNPWEDHVYAAERYNRSRGCMDVVFEMRLSAIRLLAHRTGEYAGIDAPVFEFCDDTGRPAKATQTVYRSSAGGRHPYTSVVYWDEFYNVEAGDGDDLMDQKPCACLAARAEVAALRRAFPGSLGDVYLKGENAAPPRPSPATQADAPMSRSEFELALHSFGLKTEPSRKRVIGDFVGRTGELIEQNPAAFYATVLDAVRKNPKEFGADPELVAA